MLGGTRHSLLSMNLLMLPVLGIPSTLRHRCCKTSSARSHGSRSSTQAGAPAGMWQCHLTVVLQTQGKKGDRELRRGGCSRMGMYVFERKKVIWPTAQWAK